MNFCDIREDAGYQFVNCLSFRELNLGEFLVCLVFLACRWQTFFVDSALKLLVILTMSQV